MNRHLQHTCAKKWKESISATLYDRRQPSHLYLWGMQRILRCGPESNTILRGTPWREVQSLPSRSCIPPHLSSTGCINSSLFSLLPCPKQSAVLLQTTWTLSIRHRKLSGHWPACKQLQHQLFIMSRPLRFHDRILLHR